MIRLFIKEWDGWLASDNNWARRRLKRISLTALWIICANLTDQCQFHTKSHALIDAFLASPDWAQGLLQLRAERSLMLPGWKAITVLVMRIICSRLSMFSSFQPLSGNSLNNLRAPHSLRDFKKPDSHLSVKFLWFNLIYTDT